MREQEYLNLKNHIKRDFSKEQANDLLMLVDHIRNIEENAYLVSQSMARQDQIMHLLDTKHTLRTSVLAQLIRKMSLAHFNEDVDISDLVKDETKEETANGDGNDA